MSQALHIFEKDLRRGWPLLPLWAAVLVYWIVPIWTDPLDAETFENLGGRGSTFVILAGILATGLVIHNDALVGVRELWMTQPIRPLSLLAAKISFVAVFIVAPPVLLEITVLLRFGMPADRLPAQLLDLAVPWASVVAVAALLAAWTRGLPSFLAVLAALFLIPIFGVEALKLIRRSGLHFGLSPMLAAQGLAALALLAFQFTTRRRWVGVAIGALACTGLFAGIVLSGAEQLLGEQLRQSLPEVRIQLTPGPGRDAFAAERPGATSGRAMDLWFRPTQSGLSVGRVLTVSRVKGQIEWDDGASSPFYAMGDWEVFGPGPQSAGSGSITPWRALGITGDRPFEDLLGNSGALRGRAEGAAWTLAKTQTLSLRPGAETAYGGSALRIVEVERAPGDLQLRLRSRELVDLTRLYPRLQLALVHPARGASVPLELRGGGGRRYWSGLLVDHPALLRMAEGVWGPSRPETIDPKWLDVAELRLTYYDYDGPVEVAVETPNLIIDSAETGAPPIYAISRRGWF